MVLAGRAAKQGKKRRHLCVRSSNLRVSSAIKTEDVIKTTRTRSPSDSASVRKIVCDEKRE